MSQHHTNCKSTFRRQAHSVIDPPASAACARMAEQRLPHTLRREQRQVCDCMPCRIANCARAELKLPSRLTQIMLHEVEHDSNDLDSLGLSVQAFFHGIRRWSHRSHAAGVCMSLSPRVRKLGDTSRVAREHDTTPCSELGDRRLPLGAVAHRRPALQGQDSSHAHKPRTTTSSVTLTGQN